LTHAPWTKEQVDKLNEFQQCGWVHPFTCANDHGEPKDLVAREDGWHCPQCTYHQTWAHAFMLNGAPPSPLGEWP
jgi:ubiquitin C-terminal hydrolase